MPIDTPIGRQGWRQGSVMRKDNHPKLDDHVRACLLENARVVIASHDCDVTNESYEKEPKVDLIIICPAERRQGRRAFGKNPRELELALQLAGKEVTHVAHGCNRPQNCRKLLENITPDPDAILLPQTVDQLRSWLAQRSNRSVFPDEFGKRISKIQSRIDSILDESGAELSVILMALTPAGEAGSEETYEVYLYAVMPSDLFANAASRSKAQSVVDSLKGLLRGCNGIKVIDASLKSEGQVTLDDLRHLKRFTSDYLSHKNASSAFHTQK